MRINVDALRALLSPDVWRDRLRAHGGTTLFVVAVASLLLLVTEYLPSPELARSRVEREYSRAMADMERGDWPVAIMRFRSFLRNHGEFDPELTGQAHYAIARAQMAQEEATGGEGNPDRQIAILSELAFAAQHRPLRHRVDPMRFAIALRLIDLKQPSAALDAFHQLEREGAGISGLDERIASTIALLRNPQPEEREEVRQRLAAARRAVGGSPEYNATEQARLWLAEAALEWRFGHPVRAGEDCAEALNLVEPLRGRPSALDLVAVAEYGLGKSALAAGDLKAARARFSSILAGPATAWRSRAGFGLARVDLREGNPRSAVVSLYAIAGADRLARPDAAPDEVQLAAALQCGDCFVELGDLTQAIDLYRKAMSHAPPFPPSDLFDRTAWEQRLLRMAVSASDEPVLDRLEGLGQQMQVALPGEAIGFDLAGRAAERAAALAQGRAAELRVRGETAATAESLEQADAASIRAGHHYAKALGGHLVLAHPQDYYWRAGYAFVRGGFWSGGREKLRMFLQVASREDDRRNQATYLVGRAFQETGDPEQARNYFERNLSDPDMSHLPFTYRSRLAQAEGDLALGQSESAINGLKAIFAVGEPGPNSIEYRRALFMLGEAEYAAACAFVSQRGSTPLALERLRSAVVHFEEGLRRAPDDLARRIRARFFLANIAHELNRLDGALTPGQRRRNLEGARDAWATVMATAEALDRVPRPLPPERGMEEREIAPDALEVLVCKSAFLLADSHYELGVLTGEAASLSESLLAYKTAHARYYVSATLTDLLWARIQMGNIAARLGQPNDAAAFLDQAEFELERVANAMATSAPGSHKGPAFNVAEWRARIDDAQNRIKGAD